jgi:prepilin-type N-terminal cleavage/methylation domain-containing protein
MKTKVKNHQAGFTLIEYIVAMVIAAIVGAMVYTYMGTMVTKSSEPIFRLQKASNLHQVMENIVADYNRLNALNLRYKWQAATPYTIGSVVVPATSNGYYYTCTTAGTGGSEPSHTTGTVGMWKVGGVILPATANENIVWQTGHTYLANELMIPIRNNGHYYRSTSAGTSMGSEPVAWKSSTTYAVNTIVVPSLFNGRFYRCTVAGTSHTTEPAWPTTNGGTTPDNTVTWTEVPDGTVGATLGTLRWTESGTILYRSDTTTLSPGLEAVLNDNIYNYLKTTPSRYGTGYTLVTAVANQPDFIQFDGTNTQVVPGAGTPTTSTEKNILKVTIQDSTTTQTLTELFTIR